MKGLSCDIRLFGTNSVSPGRRIGSSLRSCDSSIFLTSISLTSSNSAEKRRNRITWDDLAGVAEPSGDGERLRDRHPAPQLEFSRLFHLAGRDEKRLLEFLEHNRDDRFPENRLVDFENHLSNLWKRVSLDAEIPDRPKIQVAVRLHGEDLVEFRHVRKVQLDDVAGHQPVAPTVPRLELRGVGHWGLSRWGAALAGWGDCAPSPIVMSGISNERKFAPAIARRLINVAPFVAGLRAKPPHMAAGSRLGGGGLVAPDRHGL